MSSIDFRAATTLINVQLYNVDPLLNYVFSVWDAKKMETSDDDPLYIYKLRPTDQLNFLLAPVPTDLYFNVTEVRGENYFNMRSITQHFDQMPDKISITYRRNANGVGEIALQTMQPNSWLVDEPAR